MKTDFNNERKPHNNSAENNDIKITASHTTQARKLFYRQDVFVYLGLAVLIFCLFFLFVFPSACKQNSSKGFKVLHGSEQVLIFDISLSNYIFVSEKFSNSVRIEQNEKTYTVTIYFDEEKTDFNTLIFDIEACSAKVIESTCSESKDCVYSPKITTSGSIYCAPHNLKIVPLTDDGFVPPITG